MTVFVLIYIDQ